MKYNKSDFTLVPARQRRIGMPANLQVVYMWLCEHSNDNMQCFPSRKVLAYECGISVDTLDRSLRALVERGMIAKSERFSNQQQRSNLYEVLLIAEGPQVAAGGPQNQDQGGRKSPTQNSTQVTQPNKTTDVVLGAEPATYGKPEINELFTYWAERTGVPLTSKRQANRNACNNLLRRYDLEKMRQLIDGVAQAQADRYAPRISDFCDLQSKLNQLLTWGKARKQGGIHVV